MWGIPWPVQLELQEQAKGREWGATWLIHKSPRRQYCPSLWKHATRLVNSHERGTGEGSRSLQLLAEFGVANGVQLQVATSSQATKKPFMIPKTIYPPTSGEEDNQKCASFHSNVRHVYAGRRSPTHLSIAYVDMVCHVQFHRRGPRYSMYL